MQLHETYTLPVLDMNGEGVGICKKDGAVIFVPGAVTGDEIALTVIEVQKNYATARLVQILTPSIDRQEPDCPYYQDCGGCCHRHITREKELSVKENMVKQAMRRAGLTLSEDVFRPIRYTTPIGYRNKAVFHIEGEKIGYYADKTHTILPGTENCQLLPSIFTDIAKHIKNRLTKETTFRSLQPESLYLRRTADGKITVTLQTPSTFSDAIKRPMQDFATDIMAQFPQAVTGVLHSDHPKGKYAVPTYTLLAGERYLEERWGRVAMRISPEGFCQVNHAGAAILAETVISFAKGTLHRLRLPENTPITAADLYCGSGFFALHLAHAFPTWHIWGMEISAASIRDAQVNKEINGLENLTFFCGDAAGLPGKMGTNPTFAVIDPPRAGCSRKLCSQLTEMKPAAIAYVSCNPQTLARDLIWFRDGGYTVEVVQPVDMFAGTGHCETVVLLSRE